MYAIEIFALSTIVGCLALIKLCKYLSSRERGDSSNHQSIKSAESLLDLYESIYKFKSDDQMHRLAEWREMALQNCEARRAERVRLTEISEVSFLDDYRSLPREEGKHH